MRKPEDPRIRWDVSNVETLHPHLGKMRLGTDDQIRLFQDWTTDYQPTGLGPDRGPQVFFPSHTVMGNIKNEAGNYVDLTVASHLKMMMMFSL